jgi:CubicO group peptidase (beta-lactamase class C family)
MREALILLVVLLTFISCSKKSMEQQIDTIFEEFRSNSTPGVSAAIIKDAAIIYQKGFGLAEIEGNIFIEPKTNFRLASITKQFTALSILLLENEGKLSLTDKLTKYFPELKQSYSNITIQNVLQHTSGILDYESLANKQDTIQLRDKDVLKLLGEKDSLYFEPGTKHQYSNSGYALLALLVERLSGLSFSEYLNKRIFIPLKMNNTVAFEKGISQIINRAYGYTKVDSGFVDSDQSLYSAVLGDGGIYSSTVDLIKWDKEVNSPTLLPKEKFYQIFVKGKTTSGEDFDYGLGWRLDPYKNHERFYHTGGTSGFSNIYMKLPEYQLTIIILINLYDYDAKGYAEKIADILIK